MFGLATIFLTNSLAVARRPNGKCDNNHRYQALTVGRAAVVQEYLDGLCDALGRRRARAKHNSIRFHSLFSDPRAGRHVSTLASSTRDWRPELFFDEKCGNGKVQEEKILTQVWTSYVKDEFALTKLIYPKAYFSCAFSVMDSIGGWIEGGRIEGGSKIGGGWQQACGSTPKPSFAMDKITRTFAGTRKSTQL